MNDIVVTDDLRRSKKLSVKKSERIKRCDFCGEKVLAIAKKCKHCSEILDITLRSVEDAKRLNNAPNVFMNAAAGVSNSKEDKRNFPHGWHLFGTVITIGWWSIMWIIHYLFRDRSYYC